MKYKKMLSVLVFGLAILAFCPRASSEDKVVPSQWTPTPLKIDGLNDDWEGQTLNSQKNLDVDYGFMNDPQNLYVLVIFKNPRYLSSINLTGMTIWFNSEDSKKKDYGLRFVSRLISADQYIALLEEKAGTVSEAQKAQIRTNPRYMYFDHEGINKKSEDAPIHFSEAQGQVIPMFRHGTQEKRAIYEFMIPFQRLAEIGAEIGAEPGKTLQIGFEWGGATKKMKEAAAAQIGAEQARARPEGATGDLTEERDYVDMGGEGLAAMRRRLPKQYSFWATVKLAQSQ